MHSVHAITSTRVNLHSMKVRVARTIALPSAMAQAIGSIWLRSRNHQSIKYCKCMFMIADQRTSPEYYSNVHVAQADIYVHALSNLTQ